MTEAIASAISQTEDLRKAVFSGGDGEMKKVSARLVNIRGKVLWQIEKTIGVQVFHENLSADEFSQRMGELMEAGGFRYVNLFTAQKQIAYKISKKGKLLKSETAIKGDAPAVENHNREKEYLIPEGTPIEALVELGVFDRNYRVVKAKSDKFRQINKFIAVVDEQFRKMGEDLITVIDFGCGKSYLTFVLYYYFRFIRKKEVRIIGYDLKTEVVEHCSEAAKRFGYEGLSFFAGDIATMSLYSGKVDMIVTLHACDTATDYALEYAIRHGVKYIFSVPCCQHEVNGQLHREDSFSLVLKHGLFKERFAAILTDSIRCAILENRGYEVDVVDFIDETGTPKNAMIRGKLIHKPGAAISPEVQELLDSFGTSQKLAELCRDLQAE